MQEAIPFRIYTPSLAKSVTTQALSIAKDTQGLSDEERMKRVEEMVSENAVLLFARQGCWMLHVMAQLLLVLGVNPVVCQVKEEDEIGLQLPSMYIGGALFGGLDRLITAHISGELLPILKKAGALWL